MKLAVGFFCCCFVVFCFEISKLKAHGVLEHVKKMLMAKVMTEKVSTLAFPLCIELKL